MVKHVSHLKSNVVQTTTVDGITVNTPKLPTANDLFYGEIAVNYATGYERLSIKNDQNQIVTFVNEHDFLDTEEVITSALTNLNERITNVSYDLEDDLIDTKTSLTDSMNTMNTTLSGNISSLEENIDTLETSLTNDINELAETLGDSIQDLSDNVDEIERVVASALTDLDERIIGTENTLTNLDTRVEQAETTLENFSMLKNVTYSQLVSLKTNSQLIPGCFYRITDYVTTTVQENTQSAGHAFDVIVLATNTDTLNENAKAIKHAGDTYFANSNLNAWEIKYDINNDTIRYAWADTTNGKGVIYYMKDEWGNECPYDFKNILFKRWAVTNITSSKLNSTALSSLKEVFVYDGDNKAFQSHYAYQNSNFTNGSLTFVVNANDSDWYYTFSTIAYDPVDEEYAIDEIEDASIRGNNNIYNDENGGGCYKNSIPPYYNFMASDEDGVDGSQYLNNIVFNGYYYIDDLDMTWGYNCHSNIFGNDCHSNTFGNYCDSNTFGNYCDSNIFGNNCYFNTFGNNSDSNTFGNYCDSNTFGNYCESNTFGNYCHSNTFGNAFYSNTFGNECDSNTFGNKCDSNTFGNECDSNTFGKGCKSIIFQKDNMYYNIVENGNTFITVTSAQTTSSSSPLKNITIAQGVNNATSAGTNNANVKTISHNTVNDTFRTVYQSADSQTVNV